MKHIQPDPGWQEATVAQVRAHWSTQIDIRESRTWPVENRRTGNVDCVIGPCSLDEMLETLVTIDGPVSGQRRERGVQ